MKVTKEITIEELVETIPASVKYLMNEGIKCIACGEPIWGTLEEAAIEKGFDQDAIVGFVKDLNEMAEGKFENKETNAKNSLNIQEFKE